MVDDDELLRRNRRLARNKYLENLVYQRFQVQILELIDAYIPYETHPKGILKGINADVSDDFFVEEFIRSLFFQGIAPRLSLATDLIAIRNLTLGIDRDGSHHETPDLLKVPVIEVSSSQNIEEIELGKYCLLYETLRHKPTS